MADLHERVMAAVDAKITAANALPDRYMDWAEWKTDSVRHWQALRRIAQRHEPDREGVRSAWWCSGDHERDYGWPCAEICDVADALGIDAVVPDGA